MKTPTAKIKARVTARRANQLAACERALLEVYNMVFETPRSQVDALTWQEWRARNSTVLDACREHAP